MPGLRTALVEVSECSCTHCFSVPCSEQHLLCVVNKLRRRANREANVTTEDSSTAEDASLSVDAAPKLDLAFKEGETIKVNINVSILSHYVRVI